MSTGMLGRTAQIGDLSAGRQFWRQAGWVSEARAGRPWIDWAEDRQYVHAAVTPGVMAQRVSRSSRW